jgi:hypothetical protein
MPTDEGTPAACTTGVRVEEKEDGWMDAATGPDPKEHAG